MLYVACASSVNGTLSQLFVSLLSAITTLIYMCVALWLWCVVCSMGVVCVLVVCGVGVLNGCSTVYL